MKTASMLQDKYPSLVILLPSAQKSFEPILNKSLDPLMNNYQNLFITENSSINEYNDYELNKENIEYYNLIVEDDFGKQSLSNVESTSIISMPPQWVIKTVNYDSNAIDIIWDNIEYSKYLKHQILFSNHRYGEYNVLFESNNILENQYLGLYESQIGNWFSILTQDSVDQISISEPFLHPPPQRPRPPPPAASRARGRSPRP